MTPTKTKLTKARINLLINHPFFASILLRMPCVERTDIPTMAVDGVSLYYNADFVEKTPFDELVGVLAHEAMHIACLHHLREGARNHEKFNRAADYAINPLIEDARLSLPKDRLRKKEYDGKSAEEIYSLMPDNGQESGQGQGQGDFGGCGQVMPYPSKDPSAMAEQEQQVKIAVAQATQYAKTCGKLPDSIERMVGNLLEPSVDWREVLKRFVQDVARNDYTFRRPNQRYIATGFYLPTLYNEELGQITVAIDTSGSITQDELVEFASELNGIMSEYQGVRLTVIYCDAEVAHVDEYEGDMPVNLTMHGGGGTDFKPPFDWVEKNEHQPKCMVYFTDGCCNSFPEIPEYPTLWLATQKFNPPFGELIPLRGKFAS